MTSAAKRLRKVDWLLFMASAYVFASACAGLIGGWFGGEEMQLGARLAEPSAEHFFGTDGLGRDLFRRVIAGANTSLTIAVAVVSITSITGLCVGALLGLAGGRIDRWGSATIDVFLAFPGLLLALALTAVLGPSRGNIILALSALGWTGYARLARGQTLALRQEAFVHAAQTSGASTARILWRHLLPNILPLAIVEMTFGLAGAVLAESTLSFLGLSDPSSPSWGAMLNEGLDYLRAAPHLTVLPGLVLSMFVLSINLLGDELQFRLSPTLRAQSER